MLKNQFNMLKTFLKNSLLIIVIVLLIIINWSSWEYLRDPLAAIDMVSSKIKVVKDSTFSSNVIAEERAYHTFTLESEETGQITLLISMPIKPAEVKTPVIVILGGLHIGVQNLSFIKNPGDNILVIYNYPYSPEYWYEGTALFEIPKIRNAVLKVPAQVVEMISWLKIQKWCDEERMSILGYSFGALFTPAVYHLLAAKEITMGPGIIAYGGADIYTMLYSNLRKMDDPLKSLTAWFAATSIRAIEPSLHAPFMQNEFLIINGNQDHQIPEICWTGLHELIPEPKEIMILDEGHMHPDKPQLTYKLVDISRSWLLERGILNP